MNKRSELWGHRKGIDFALNILKTELKDTKKQLESDEYTERVRDLLMDNCIMLESAINKIKLNFIDQINACVHCGEEVRDAHYIETDKGEVSLFCSIDCVLKWNDTK